MRNNKFSKSIRLLALALSVAMLLACFSGCGKKADDGEDEYEEYTSTIVVSKDENGNVVTDTNDDNTGNTAGNSDSKTNSTASTGSTGSSSKNDKGNSTDLVSKSETKGKTFTIVSSLLPDRNSKNKTLFETLFYQRVAEVEKEYGITIKVVNTMGGSADKVAPLIQAGKPVGNIVETQVRWLPALISAGYIKAWDEVPGINVNNANFNSGYTKVATVGSKHYGLQFMKPSEVRYCVVMNKKLLNDAGINADAIYDLINKKKWNYDTLLDYAKKTTNPGKGIYGIGGNPEYLLEMLMSGNNAKIVTLASNGKATPTYTSKNVVGALDFMNKIVNVEKVYKTNASMSKKIGFNAPDYISEFVQGKCTFLFEDSWVINQMIRPKVKNFDYGMITVPLGPQGTAYTSSSGHARVFYITSTNKDLEFTATIFNALAKPPAGYSGDQWWKDEIQLDYFQNKDNKSLGIYDFSLKNMSFDYGLGMDNVFEGFKDAAFGSIFWNSGKTPSAAISGIKGNFDNAINKFFNK